MTNFISSVTDILGFGLPDPYIPNWRDTLKGLTSLTNVTMVMLGATVSTSSVEINVSSWAHIAIVATLPGMAFQWTNIAVSVHLRAAASTGTEPMKK